MGQTKCASCHFYLKKYCRYNVCMSYTILFSLQQCYMEKYVRHNAIYYDLGSKSNVVSYQVFFFLYNKCFVGTSDWFIVYNWKWFTCAYIEIVVTNVFAELKSKTWTCIKSCFKPYVTVSQVSGN